MSVIATMPDSIVIEPGSQRDLAVNVVNTGTIVDDFRVEILGPAAAWARATPDRLALMPGDEATITVTFSPPRSSAMVAAEVPFAVKVTSQVTPGESVVEEGELQIGAFRSLDVQLHPSTISARKFGRTRLTLDNQGNRAETLTLSGEDPRGCLRLGLPASIDLPPGTATGLLVRVRPARAYWTGVDRHLPFTLSAAASDEAPRELAGTLVQRPLLGRGLIRVLARLLVILTILALLWFVFLRPVIRSAAADQAKSMLEVQEQSAVTSRPPPPAGASGGQAGPAAAEGQVGPKGAPGREGLKVNRGSLASQEPTEPQALQDR